MKLRHKQAPGSVELVEDAVHLLRETRLSTWLVYYTGTVPFVLGLLYFWADMSQSAFAAQHATGAALGMAGLFFWMKSFQALFTARLRTTLIGVPVPERNWRGFARVVADQIRQQAWALFLLPVGAVLVVPGMFVFGFFQVLTVLPEDPTGGSSWKRAWKESVRWPAEDAMTLLLLLALWLMLALNVFVLVVAAPWLLKTLLDYETLFSRSPWTALNTTLLMSVAMVSWLCWDPMVKATCVIRVFRGEGRESGLDLVARLRHTTRKAAAALCLSLLFFVTPSFAADHVQSGESSGTVVSAEAAPTTVEELNRSIDEVLRQRRYSWRIPREEVDETSLSPKESAFQRWLEGVGKSIESVLKRFARWLGEIFQPQSRTASRSNISFADAGTVLKWILILLIVVVLGALLWLLAKAWIARPRVVSAATDSVQAVPDVADENVGADQLPEDGWMRLAMELMGKGDFRLALRALYLASLAHLAQREMIRLARHKSNRDYLWEVGRRARALPEVTAAFSTNVGSFDRVWYGRHEATDELVREFRSNVERIRAC